MKKITLLIILMVSSLGNSQTLEGTWKISPQAGALGVGGAKGDIGWWSNSIGDVTARACLFDDEYVFHADGSFNNILGAQTFNEGWQNGGADACGAPIAPHNGSNAATWAYEAVAKTVTLSGVGAYLGLPKAYNGGELSAPGAPSAPASRTYTVTALTANTLTLDIAINGAGWWRFILAKQGLTPTCTDGVKNGDETGVDCGGASCAPCAAAKTQINLPVTFEGTAIDYTMTDFGGNNSSKEIDPTDPNNTVMKIIKTVGAEGWAGTTMGAGVLGFSTAVPFSPSNKKMYVRVWTPAANIKVRLKVEDHLNVNHYVEQDVLSTMVGWQTLMFDFATPATAPYDSTFIYDKASIYFNFIPDVKNAVEATYYFDNVNFGSVLGTSSFTSSKIKIYPNPASNTLNIQGNAAIDKVSLYTILGQEVLAKSPKTNQVSLDISNLQNGMYIVKTTSEGLISTSRVLKQ